MICLETNNKLIRKKKYDQYHFYFQKSFIKLHNMDHILFFSSRLHARGIKPVQTYLILRERESRKNQLRLYPGKGLKVEDHNHPIMQSESITNHSKPI